MNPGSQLSPDAIAAIEAGNLIGAIKIIRSQTGLGLKESKDLLDAYMAGHPIQVPEMTAQIIKSTPPEALAALEAGNKIEAIRIIRERMQLSLKDAKDLADRHDAAAAPVSLSSGDLNRVEGGSKNWLGLVLILVIVIGIYLWLSR